MMAKPDLETLRAPAALEALPLWLVWRFEPNGNKKPRKVPYYISGARRHWSQGTAADRKNLTSFEAAKKVAIARGYSGVGFAPLPECGVSALDFDDCVVDGVIDPLVESLCAGTYTEFSPSGNGIRAFVTGSLGTGKDSPPKNPEDRFGFEVFDCNGFITFTGNLTEDTILTCSQNILAPITEHLQTYRDSRLKRSREPFAYEGSDEKTLGLTDQELAKILGALPDDLSYDEWLNVGMALHHETQGQGFAMFDEWSLSSPKGTTTEYNLERWASFGKYGSGPPFTCRSLLRYARDELHVETGVDIDTASIDEFDNLEPLPGKFGIRHQADFAAQQRHVEWIIKNVIPKAQLGILFGESGSGKSFAAYDMCAAIVRGQETWNGNRIPSVKRRVLYVIAEGVAGFRQRIKAYCHQHALKPSDIDIDVISDVTPNLLDPAQITDMIKEIKRLTPYDLIVMDTFAQVMPGANENSGEDVGKALQQCKRIHHHTGAMVLLIHHSGKDSSKGARGWSGLKAAADVELEVNRSGEMRSITVSKLKDGKDGQSYGFSLGIVPLGEDEDGDEITSCVVLYNASGRVKRSAAIKIGDNEKLLLQVIDEANVSGEEDASGVAYEALCNLFVRELEGDGTPKYKKQAFNRALNSLIDKGLLHKDGEEICKGAENA